MKRYKMAIKVFKYRIVNIDENLSINAIEHPEGEWARHEDVKAEIDRIRRSYEHRISALEGIYLGKRTHFIPKEIPVCNCAEKSDSARKKANTWPEWPVGLKRLRPHWICPAHGYKRL